ncbi:MAG: signal peptidase I [Nitrospirae bacterium]|nr:signal peptidase I [Nitrospirota bacterium]
MAKQKSKLREYIEAILTALVLALLIRAVVIQAFKIPSGSMIPTLSIGDHILVNKFIYGTKIPFVDKRILTVRETKRGDIIVFSFPKNGEECESFFKNLASKAKNIWDNKSFSYLLKDDCKDFIKRVIGTGGDKIEIKNKTVYVNGTTLDEPFTIHSQEPCPDMGPYIVPKGKFFVMGDNRDQSYDSRFWGYVDMDKIKGKAIIIYWSWDSREQSAFKRVKWGRIGKLVQ